MRFFVDPYPAWRSPVSDDDVKTAVQSWTAETQMRAVQDYVSRGRRLEHSPEEALAGAWVGLVRAWAKSPEKGQDPRRVDIEAEYSLRGSNPPYELIREEMEMLVKAAAGAIEDMDEIDQDRINGEILNLRSGEKSRTN
jgi:hypothetical protein